MNSFLFSAIVLISVLFVSVEGFKTFSAPTSTVLQRKTLTRFSEKNEVADKEEVSTDEMKLAVIDYSKNIVDYFKKLDPDTLSEEAKDISESFLANSQAGPWGFRGEPIELLHWISLGILASGHLPFVETAVNVLAGPVLLVFAIPMYLLAIRDLGTNLSPWVASSEKNVLTTTGLYSVVRHPIYTAEILGALALANLTGDLSRYIMVVVLFYVLDRKASLEEESLTEKHPVYKVYKDEVPKFFPKI